MSAIRFTNGARARALALAALAGLVLASAPTGAGTVLAAPKPVEEKTKSGETKKNETTPKQQIPNVPELRKPGDPPPTGSTGNDVYRAILRQYPGGKSPADTLGNGVFPSRARPSIPDGSRRPWLAPTSSRARTRGI